MEFPDLEGCQTCGSTLQEAMEWAQETLGLYIATLDESNIKIPDASDIKKIKAFENSFVFLVPCDAGKHRRKTRAVKKTLTIPEWLNEEAEKRHVNFSSVLQEALKEILGMNKA